VQKPEKWFVVVLVGKRFGQEFTEKKDHGAFARVKWDGDQGGSQSDIFGSL
jgi:hypothetical protein